MCYTNEFPMTRCEKAPSFPPRRESQTCACLSAATMLLPLACPNSFRHQKLRSFKITSLFFFVTAASLESFSVASLTAASHEAPLSFFQFLCELLKINGNPRSTTSLCTPSSHQEEGSSSSLKYLQHLLLAV